MSNGRQRQRLVLREDDDSRLGHAVRSAGPGRDPPRHRRYVDDPAVPPRFHVNDHGVRDAHYALDVHLEDLVPVVPGELVPLLPAAGADYPRVVDEDVDAPELRDDRVDGRVDRLLAGHVDTHAERPATRARYRGRRLLCLALVDVARDHVGAAARKRRGYAPSDASSAAGDQRHPVAKVHFQRPLICPNRCYAVADYITRLPFAPAASGRWGRHRHWREGCVRPSIRAGGAPALLRVNGLCGCGKPERLQGDGLHPHPSPLPSREREAGGSRRPLCYTSG